MHIIKTTLLMGCVLLAGACSGGNERSGQQAAQKPAGGKTDVVTVYYFHNNHRCYTCNLFEETVNSVVKNDLKEQSGSGKLVFESLNMDEPGNRHFVKTYKLHTKAIVVSVMENGKEVQWKNLDRIWELSRDTGGLREYIRTGITGLLDS